MKRKLMLILLATVMALALAIPAIADSTIYTEGTLHYKVGDGTITIVGCFGKNEKVTVPAMIAGIPVNTIASGAFAENTYVKIVYLPDTISKVEPGAFASWITVIYNANTDHPQTEPTDLILGKTPSGTTAGNEPDVTQIPEITEAPEEPETPKPTEVSGTVPVGQGESDVTGESVTPTPTPKPNGTKTSSPTAKSGGGKTTTSTPKPTETFTAAPTENGTVVDEADYDLTDEDVASPIPTDAPTEEPTEEPAEVVVETVTKAPTEQPVKTEPVITNAPTTEKTVDPVNPKTGAWGWLISAAGLAALVIVAIIVLRRKKK